MSCQNCGLVFVNPRPSAASIDRLYAAELYGLMAKVVLNSWGVKTTGDFGEIVYKLIEVGEMTKSKTDRREDFDDVYDFQEALVRDFVIAKED